MKIEIWSDIMCPFCYIGKRRLESALVNFKNAAEVEIQWRSFQLDPTIKNNQNKTVFQYLEERKGISPEQVLQMHDQLKQVALNEGLQFNFDIAKIANSFDAHRLIQLSKTHHRGDQMEERLFKAYFTEGKDFGDHQTLIQLSKEVGLDENTVIKTLQQSDFSLEVKQDISEAQNLGIRGVPFFLFDKKYAISGAQPLETFIQTLEVAYSEWKKENPFKHLIKNDEGSICDTEGNCN